jgi:hypothetical protein
LEADRLEIAARRITDEQRMVTLIQLSNGLSKPSLLENASNTRDEAVLYLVLSALCSAPFHP